jgi:phosphoserine phosphatase RsbU/P
MAVPRKAVARFKERSELLDFLLEVSTVTSETLDLDRLLANVSEIVKRVVNADLMAILLYSERTQRLRIRYAFGHRLEVVNNLTLTTSDGIIGAAATSREPVIVGNVRSDPRYLVTIDAVQSEMAVPMLARGRLVGVIDLQSTRPNAYNEDDRALLRLIASRVGSTIDNARLYRRVDRNARTLRTLSAISSEISSILDLDILLDRISKRVRELIPYDAFSIFLVTAEERYLKHRFSMRYDQKVVLDNIPIKKGITGAAATSREPVRVVDTQADPRYIPSHPGIRSEVAVPLVVQDRLIGVMDLESDQVGAFTEDHVRTLTLLAPQVATSVENARLYEEVADRQRRIDQDLQAASELQQLLLPRIAPEISGLDMGIGLRPAREISGDIYDFFQHGEDHGVIAFGDVSGKGVAAALFGALVGGLLRTLAPRRRSPAVLLRALNDALVERKVEARYVTLLVILWHPHSRQMSMSNAGALPPLVVRNGEPVKIRVEGVPLGLLEDREYEDSTFQTQPGDTIVLFSDGITDQLNSAGHEYGRKRLVKVVSQYHGLPAQEIVSRIFEDLDNFSEDTAAFDDQTLLVVKVK